MNATESASGITAVIAAAHIVNQVIRAHPETVEVFKKFGIDACCGGASAIRDAAIRDGVDPDVLLGALNDRLAHT